MRTSSIICAWIVAVSTIASAADAGRATYRVDIPAQDLADALQAVALASRYKLLYAPKLVAGRRSPALSGSFTVEEAIKRLLFGTDLSYEVTADGLILVRAAREVGGGSQPSPTAPVESSDSLDGPEASSVGGAAETAGRSKLEEVLVTATKRAIDAQATDLSLTVLDGYALERAGVHSVADLGAQVPSLLLGNDNSDWKVTIRGAGSDNVGINAAQGVALHIDGVYVARPAGFNALTYDVDRIEVLRGPQGTLYGQNATGGAINVISNPPASEFGAQADVLTGSYDWRRVRGVLNVPSKDDEFIWRLSALNETRDGYERNVGPGKTRGDDAHQRHYRGQVLWKLGEDASIIARGSMLQQRGVGPARVRPASPPNANSADGSYTPEFKDPRTVYKDQPESRDLKLTIYSAEANWDLHWAQATAILGFSDYELSATQDGDLSTIAYPAPGGERSILDFAQSAEQFDVEVRLSSPSSDRLRWLVGLFYMDEDAHDLFTLDQIQTAPPSFNFPPFSDPPGTPGKASLLSRSYTTVATTSMAMFTELSIPVAEKFSVTAGLRYTDDRIGGHLLEDSTRVSTAAAPPGFTVMDHLELPADKSWEKTTWKLGLQWQLADDELMYLTASTGFRSGGFNVSQTDPDHLYYRPEDLLAIEFGWKRLLLDDRAKLNLAVFYYDYRNLQVLQLIDFAELVDNARAESYGLEAEAALKLSDRWSLDGHVALIRAKYKDYRSQDPVFPLGPDGVESSGDELNELSGNDLIQTPRASGHFALTYSIPCAGHGRLDFRAQVYAQSEMFLRAFNLNPYDKQGSYTKTSLGARFDSNARWFLYGGVDNLENDDIVAGVEVTPLGRYFVNLRAPRTWFLGAGVEF